MPDQNPRPSRSPARWLIEACAVFAVLAALNAGLAAYGSDWAGPHLYWIGVVLISATHGLTPGLAAVLIASALTFLFDGKPRPASGDYYAWFMAVGREPMAWLVTATTLGLLRRRQVDELDRLSAETSEANVRTNAIAGQYVMLRGRVDALERQIVLADNVSDRALRAVEALARADDDRTDPLALVAAASRSSSLRLMQRSSGGWTTSAEFGSAPARSYGAALTEIAGHDDVIVVTDPSGAALADHGLAAVAPLRDPASGAVSLLLIDDLDPDFLTRSGKAALSLVAAALANRLHASAGRLACNVTRADHVA